MQCTNCENESVKTAVSAFSYITTISACICLIISVAIYCEIKQLLSDRGSNIEIKCYLANTKIARSLNHMLSYASIASYIIAFSICMIWTYPLYITIPLAFLYVIGIAVSVQCNFRVRNKYSHLIK